MTGSARTKRELRHLGFAAAVVILLVLVRLLASGPVDLADLDRIESTTGVGLGPAAPFFTHGLNGDGATFAVIAADPFGQEIGSILRSPSYRYLRFGYPWVASVLVWGTDDLLLLGLSVVGFVSVGVSAYVASKLSTERGWPAWLLVANPALLFGVLGDTAEPMALALLGLAIYTNSAFLGWLVSFVRPSFLVAIAARWRLFLGALVTVGIVKLIWSWHFEQPFLTGSHNVSWPFVGVMTNPSSLGWVVLAAGLATAIVGIIRRDLSWVVGGVSVVFFGPTVASINAVRAAGFLPVLWAFGPRFGGVGSATETRNTARDQRWAGHSYPER